MKKWALTLICAAVALPSIAQAFFFGVTLSDAAGVTLAAADPFQTGAILSVGLLGAALVFALGRFSGDYYKFPDYIGGGYGGPYYTNRAYNIEQGHGYYNPTHAYAPQSSGYNHEYAPQNNGYNHEYTQQSGGYNTQSNEYGTDENITPTSSYDSISPYYNDLEQTRRRRRSIQEVENELILDEVFNTLLGNIYKGRIEGCFQRLVCDMAARPDDFPQNTPILQGVEMMETHKLNSTEATAVSRLLLEAAKFGRNTTDVNECEAAFNDCYWSGQQMDLVISKFDNQVTIEA